MDANPTRQINDRAPHTTAHRSVTFRILFASTTAAVLLVSTGCALPAFSALHKAIKQDRVAGISAEQRITYVWPEPTWGVTRTATLNGLFTTDTEGNPHHMSAVAIQNATTREWELVAVLQQDDEGNWTTLNLKPAQETIE